MKKLELTDEMIRAAIQGMELKRVEIDARIEELQAELRGSHRRPAGKKGKAKVHRSGSKVIELRFQRRALTPAARKRIAMAQKKR